MKKSNEAAKRKKPSLPILLLLFSLLCALCIGGLAAARYVLRQDKAGLATAESFYFTSDYLRESSENAVYYIDPENNSFHIELYNFADSQRWATSAITYTVSAEGATVDSAGGVLNGSGESREQIIVTPTVKAGESFTVTAQSNSPYKKTLTATFHMASGNRFQVEDKTGNIAAVLTVTCVDGKSPIPLTLPEGVVPDATDDRVTTMTGESGKYTFQPSGPGVYSVVLLKSRKEIDLSKNSQEFNDTIDITGTVS